MEYIIVAFRSRAHTVKFYEYLRRNGVASEIINTPKEAGVGCGLSVKIAKERLALVKNIVRSLNISSFAGFFIYKNTGGNRSIRTI